MSCPPPPAWGNTSKQRTQLLSLSYSIYSETLVKFRYIKSASWGRHTYLCVLLLPFQTHDKWIIWIKKYFLSIQVVMFTWIIKINQFLNGLPVMGNNLNIQVDIGVKMKLANNHENELMGHNAWDGPIKMQWLLTHSRWPLG